jgi:DNA helicase-2/ATP-dependent DNA helicase PcrA
MRTRSAARATASTRVDAQTKLPVSLEYGLNPEQVEVVRYAGGPLRVLALAGSGKTESLSRLIARLVLDGADATRILAVTFAKKGADEMSTRIAKKFGVSGARVGTWHSLCLQIIREDNLEAARWTVEGEKGAPSPKVVLKEVVGWKGMDWKGVDIAALSGFIGRCKANLFTPDAPGALALAQRFFGWQSTKAVQAFSRYNDALAEKCLLTFDDFLVFTAEHLQRNENARASWAARWDYVFQDEKQDANRAQDVIASLLARDHRNYVVIGDCFQAIYGFRGSSPEFLAKFDLEWTDAKTITLPRNYRSGRAIIAAANAVVGKASIEGLAVPTAMIGERDLEGEVRVLCGESLDDEANSIGNAIQSSVANGDTKHSAHCILVRTNAQSRALEEALLTRRIPYVVVGGVSFYERKEVRDLLAYLRLADRRGSKDDIKRSINTPFRFLGMKFVERVMSEVDGADGDVDWCRVVDDVAGQTGIQQRQMASANEWARMIRGMQKTIDAGAEAEAKGFDLGTLARIEAQPAKLLEGVVTATRYIDWLNREEGGETTENSGAANVREMVRVAERFATAGELLDYIDETIKTARKQRDDKQAGGERVLLMSVHRSKGLEWPHVYVAGLNEMILPHAKGDAEEERRLAYVAMTRARDVLTLSYVRRIATRAGIKDVEPSRFLLDTGLALDAPAESSAHA